MRENGTNEQLIAANLSYWHSKVGCIGLHAGDATKSLD